jgi:hypothetical protein
VYVIHQKLQLHRTACYAVDKSRAPNYVTLILLNLSSSSSSSGSSSSTDRAACRHSRYFVLLLLLLLFKASRHSLWCPLVFCLCIVIFSFLT